MSVRERLRHALSSSTAQGILACALAFLLVFGETGASTESRLSFLVSGWKVAVVLLVIVLLIATPPRSVAHSIRSYFKNPLVLALCAVFVLMSVDTAVAVFLNGSFSAKAIVRSITFYGAVVLAGYCAFRVLGNQTGIVAFRFACRFLLVAFLILAFFEIVSDIHLPGNRLTDPDLLAILGERNLDIRRYVATGIFYNENNFSVFLVVLAVLSLPFPRDSVRSCVFSLVLVALVLVETSVVGATIASFALLVAFAMWLLVIPWYWGVRLALLAGFITLAVGVTSPAMDFIFWISNLLGFPSHTDLTAGEVGLIAGVEGQMSNLDTGSGSMWKRLTMYGDLAGIAAAHPFGVGPGMIGPYFEANPSASGLSNPHNWWLEFLCLYGIPATIAYAAFLFYALVQMAVRYRKTGQFTCVLAIVSYIAVGFGSVAPSSFDYTAYAWIPVLLAIASFQNEEDRKRCLIGGDIDPACPPRILFVSFKDLDAPASSASIKRPREMLRAFRDIGCDVMVLEGLPNRYMERNRNVSSLMRSIRSGERVFDLCYVEPPAGPMLCRRDLSLLRLIRQRGIPLGYFYRDAYWLTEDALAGASFKQRVIYFLSKRDFETFNAAATIIYHPGAVSVDWAMKAAASKGHPYKAQAGILPPGCEWVSEAATSHVISGEAPTAIYVGAADERYGTPLLLDSFMRINEKEVVCRLIFVCPKNQWDTLDARYQVLKDSVDWLDVEHLAAGEELARVYSRADIGLMSYRRCEYNDAAIPVKMFEYLSYCKPIVTTDIPGAASFVREWNLGLVVPDAASSYAAAIERLVNTPDLLDYYRENARQAVPHNTWKSRALQVCRDLLEDMSS